MLGSVLGTPAIVPRTASQDIRLCRAVRAGLEAGRLWSGGGLLLFSEDLRWGKQVYRSQKLPKLGGVTG